MARCFIEEIEDAFVLQETGPRDIIMFSYRKFDIESILLQLSLLGKYSGLLNTNLR
jgi:hypothetical protein